MMRMRFEPGFKFRSVASPLTDIFFGDMLVNPVGDVTRTPLTSTCVLAAGSSSLRVLRFEVAPEFTWTAFTVVGANPWAVILIVYWPMGTR